MAMKVFHQLNSAARVSAVFPEDFRLVAEVDTNRPDRAFALTTHQDDHYQYGSWIFNVGVTPMQLQPRSSREGGIFVRDNGRAG